MLEAVTAATFLPESEWPRLVLREAKPGKHRAPACLHCGGWADLVGAFAVYGATVSRRPDLRRKEFWRCTPCNAWVGCHPGTKNALGSPANAETRPWRSAVHVAFDPLWRSGGMQRWEAYRALADLLSIPAGRCHVSWFDIAWCQRALAAVAILRPESREAESLA